jgi:glycine betaine/proline transport system ATP-binding protein
MPLALQGMGKTELFETHNHILGLQDINIDIKSGEITVIMGLSGSGKSTLIRHINRLIDPTLGVVEINGQNVLELNQEEMRDLRRHDLAMVFQKFALLPHKTVVQNVALSSLARGEEFSASQVMVEYWLNRVGLEGYGDNYPGQLSGGMQQRVGIARALASDCEIMLMDEAFSALDPLIRTDMQDLLLDLQRDLHKTIIFITHDLDEALKLADHLVILKDGCVVQQGDPQKILLNPVDPYIEAFVGDVNRARVLRVRSVMNDAIDLPVTADRSVQTHDTLEKVIALSGGKTSAAFAVQNEKDERVGSIDMQAVIRALVPETHRL